MILGVDVEAERILTETLLDLVIQTNESSTTDEENVRGVDLDVFLIRMLAAALGRNIASGALKNLQQRLLHPFSGNVASDGNVFGGAADFIDLVDIDDATLGLLHIVIGRLEQAEDHVFHVLTHVTGLGECGGIGNSEGYIENLREGAGEQGFARTGGTDKHDVALLDLDLAELRRHRGGVPIIARTRVEIEPLVVIIDRNREHLFGVILTDDKIVEHLFDLGRLDQSECRFATDSVSGLGLNFAVDDRLTDVDAGVTDVDTWSGDDFTDFRLRFTAERAQGHARGFSHDDLISAPKAG